MRTTLPLLFTLVPVVGYALGFHNTYDYEARRWRTNVIASGASVSDNTYRIATTFMLNIKAWGLRGTIKCCNLYAGTGLNACLWPIINDQGLVIDGNIGPFVSADYSESTGLTGDGLTKYTGASWNFEGTADQKNSAHIALYNRSATDEAGVTQGVGVGNNRAQLSISFGGTTYFILWDVNGTYSVTDSAGTGFYMVTRRGDADVVLYKNGASFATNSSPGTSSPIGGATVHTLLLSGSSVSPTARTLSFFGFGNGIADARQLSYWKAVQRVQIGLGRHIGTTAL